MIKVLDVLKYKCDRMDALDRGLKKYRADAYVIYASSNDADMRYLSRFKTNDPFVYFKRKGELGTIIVSQMEYTRAKRESTVAVISRTEAGLMDILKKEKNPWKATAKMIAGQVNGKILVPPKFPLALAQELKNFVKIIVDDGILESIRAVKTNKELQQIQNVQNITQGAMELALSYIKKSKVKNDILYFNGKPLTSERVRIEIHKFLLNNGCRATDTIVSCGEDAAIPHNMGNGPLHSGSPIVIDMFPQDETSGYYTDMTRTVSKGETESKILEMYGAVREAQKLGMAQVRPGISGSEIHQEVVDFFKDLGYESGAKGFMHNLGHGIGLEVHEAPSVGPSGKKLVKGNVITLEPGLYYPGIGGVRLEDIGSVTSKGFKRFTKFPKELVI